MSSYIFLRGVGLFLNLMIENSKESKVNSQFREFHCLSLQGLAVYLFDLLSRSRSEKWRETTCFQSLFVFFLNLQMFLSICNSCETVSVGSHLALYAFAPHRKALLPPLYP